MAASINGRNVYLDAGRGVAALVVLWHHVLSFNDLQIRNLLAVDPMLLRVLDAVSSFNVDAVMFFFFISGWSIWLSILKLTSSDGRLKWRTYLIHRARRILPVYWLSMLWAFCLTSEVPQPYGDRSVVTLVGNLVFLQSSSHAVGTWFVPFAGNGPLWSLSYEIWYYIAVLALYLIVASVPKMLRRIEIGMIAAFTVGVFAIGVNRLKPNPFALFATLWPVWIAGYLFGYALKNNTSTFRFFITAVFIIATLTASTVFIKSDTLIVLTRGFSVASIISIAVAVCRYPFARTFVTLRPFAILARALAYVGHGSYAIYLMHYSLLIVLAHQRAKLWVVGVAVLLLVTITPMLESLLQHHLKRLFVKFESARPGTVPAA